MKFTLARFGRNETECRWEYRAFVEGVSADRVGNPLKELAYGAILGGEQFTAEMRERLEGRRVDPEVSQMIQVVSAVSLSTIADEIAAAYGCSVGELRTRGRKGHKARDMAIWLSREMSRESLQKIGDYFGGIRPSAVSHACRRIRERMQEDADLKNRVEILAQGMKK
jgi:chromosomal replication initiation ATPase DnaA